MIYGFSCGHRLALPQQFTDEARLDPLMNEVEKASEVTRWQNGELSGHR